MKALNIALLMLVGLPMVAMAGKKPPVVTCTMDRLMLDDSARKTVVSESCKTFNDPEFGVSAQCNFQPFEYVRVEVTAQFGKVSEVIVHYKGVTTYALTHYITLINEEEGSGVELTVLCADPK